MVRNKAIILYYKILIKISNKLLREEVRDIKLQIYNSFIIKDWNWTYHFKI